MKKYKLVYTGEGSCTIKNGKC